MSSHQTSNLALYECSEIIAAIEARAEQAGGEISDEDLQALVVAQTTSMVKLEKLCGFVKFVEHTIDLCKQEETRLVAKRKTAERRLESIKKFLVPFVSQYRREKGHPVTVGTFTLSTRRSESVEIDELAFATDENRAHWCTEKVTYQPDKKRIKEELQNPLATITGASLVEKESLQIR